MGKINDLTGAKFGRLMVDSFAGMKVVGNSGRRRSLWRCSCECGAHVDVTANSLTTGSTSSCGCLHHEVLVRRNRSEARNVKGHHLYTLWTGMRSRCRNPNATDYAIYGGRGIIVCEHWDLFENFAADMGDRPSGCTLDRIDPNGNYEPGNCRWATSRQQGRNKVKNRRISFRGATKCISEWAEETGLDKTVIAQRLNRGWKADDALTVPTNSRATLSARRLIVRRPGATLGGLNQGDAA